MNILYSTKVTATGGRHGQVRSEDGLLDMNAIRGNVDVGITVLSHQQ